jgi:hypothetical protein
MEADAAVACHRQQVKEDASGAESNERCHATQCLTRPRHGDFDGDVRPLHL